MKKYTIKYQDENEIKEITLETSNISNENLPQNIISINEYKKSFNFSKNSSKTLHG